MAEVQLCYVEDDVALAQSMRAMLERHPGWHVTVASSRAEGAAVLRSGRFDAVLLDHRLPDGSGLELIPGIRERTPQTRIIVLTGAGDEEVAMRAYELGAVDYAVKGPELARTIVPRLEALLGDATGSVKVSGGAGRAIGKALFDRTGRLETGSLPRGVDAGVLGAAALAAVGVAGQVGLAHGSAPRGVLFVVTLESSYAVVATRRHGFGAAVFDASVGMADAIASTMEWLSQQR